MVREYNELIEELTEIEMQSGSHVSNEEEFDSLEDFFLENVTLESYVSYFLKEYLTKEEQKKYNLNKIQDDVINEIKLRCKKNK